MANLAICSGSFSSVLVGALQMAYFLKWGSLIPPSRGCSGKHSLQHWRLANLPKWNDPLMIYFAYAPHILKSPLLSICNSNILLLFHRGTVPLYASSQDLYVYSWGLHMQDALCLIFILHFFVHNHRCLRSVLCFQTRPVLGCFLLE